MGKSRLLAATVAMMVLAAVGVGTASAGLVYSVYLEPGGAYSGPETQSATFTTGELPVGSQLTFQVYVTVSGTDAVTTNDTVTTVMYNVRSNSTTSGVAIKGTMSAPSLITTDFTKAAGVSPAQLPTVKDLNGDTYFDLGSTTTSSLTGWAVSSSTSALQNGATPTMHPSMTFTYTVGQDSTGTALADAYNPGGSNLIITVGQRVSTTGATWMMDGATQSGTSAGITFSPVTIALTSGGGPAVAAMHLASATNPTIFVNGTAGASVQVSNTGDATSTLDWAVGVAGAGVTVSGAAQSGTGLKPTDPAVAASYNVSSGTVGSTPLTWTGSGNGGAPTLGAALTVLAHSTLSLSPSSAASAVTVPLGNLLQGAVAGYNFTVNNYGSNAPFTAAADIIGVSADAGLSSNVVTTTGIAAGTGGGYQVSFDTASNGSFSRTLTISGQDAAALSGTSGWGNATSVTVTLTGTVGTATLGGPALTAAVAAGGSYVGLSSTAGGTTAKILWGTNVGGTDSGVSMSWRAPNPSANPYEALLASNVLDLTGMNNSPTSSQTDPFVLSMSFDPAAMAALAASKGLTVAEMQQKGMIFLATNDSGSGPWVNAVSGNFGNDATAAMNQLGAFDPANLDDLKMGAWGVDLSSNTVWAMLDHNTNLAVVPEPATMAFLTLGGLAMAGSGLLRRRRTAGK